jgi:hypothetical protein
MPAVTRSSDFIRNFARFKKAAAKGALIRIVDRGGVVFRFSLMTTPSLGAQTNDLCGALNTGIRVKNLAGFGGTRRGRRGT